MSKPTTTEHKPRVEQTFHDQMWAPANDSMKLERAATEGRDLAYEILKRSQDDTLCWMAEGWLEAHGRDHWRESREAKHAS